MKPRRLCALALAVAACGSDPVPTPADAGFPDAAPPVDAGVRALCPMLAAPACAKADTCGMATPATNGCAGCRPRYDETCTFGACVTPAAEATLVSVATDFTEVLGAMPRSLVLTGISAETAGGLELTCADLTAGTVTIDEPCVTVLESRRWNVAELRPTGQIYSLFSSQFPTSGRALFLVQAYSEPLGNGMVVGNACAELPANAPQDGNGRIDISAGVIHRL